MISVVLATYNEEKNLAKCLNSVRDWADEIVVVDGSSIDKTREIAKKYRALIVKTTNKLNFHINKQMAIDHAKGDLVLQLDADEVVDEELRNFILELNKKVAKTKISAWYLKRKNYFFGRFLKKGGQYPDQVIRLFKKNRAYLPAKDVHEQMVVKGVTKIADGHLLHYSNPRFAVYWHKFNTYTSFKAHQLEDSKVKINFFSFFYFVFYKPILTFFNLYFRHKGFVDGWAGFIFAYFSGFYFLVSYLKYYELTLNHD